MVDEDRERHRQRLVVMEGLVAAQERRGEVFNVVSSAATADEARAALVVLLDLQESFVADAVLDMQARRWTQEACQQMRTERDELRAWFHES